MKKIFLLGIIIILAFLAGIFAAFYFHIEHTPIASLLAKIFQEQPLPFKANKKFDGKIYFVTNRKPEFSDKTINFANDPSNTISYGVVTVEIPTSHRLGNTLIFDVIKKINILSEQDFYQALTRAQKPMILWIHGYKNSFKTSTLNYAQIANDLNTQGTFVTYDWASNESPLGYAQDVSRLQDATGPLVKLLDKIVTSVKPPKLTLIAHSLGCRLVCMAFDELYKSATWSDKEIEFTNVIFLAPNIDRNEFDQNFKKQLMSMVRKLTVYVASNDNALLLSKMLYNTDSLGLPKEFLPTSNLDEIQALLHYQGELPDKIDIVDVSYFSKKGVTSHLYFEDRPVLEDLHGIIDDATPIDKRYLLRYNEDHQTSQSYWIIPP